MTTEPGAALERRYRRLLAFRCPGEHRLRHGGETLAVVSGAHKGQLMLAGVPLVALASVGGLPGRRNEADAPSV